MHAEQARYELLDEEDLGPFTLSQFLSVNQSLDPQDVASIRCLRPGEVHQGGGGAGAEWGVRCLASGGRLENPRAREADYMCLCGHPFGLHDNEMGEIPVSQAPCSRCQCPGAIRRFRRGNPRGAASTDQYLESLAAARRAQEQKRVLREQTLLARQERAERPRPGPAPRPRGGIPTWAIMEREGNPVKGGKRPAPPQLSTRQRFGRFEIWTTGENQGSAHTLEEAIASATKWSEREEQEYMVIDRDLQHQETGVVWRSGPHGGAPRGNPMARRPNPSFQATAPITRGGTRAIRSREENPTDMSIAHTILQQMGGTSRLGAMVGARNFVALENGVQFSIGSGAKNRINKVVVALEPDDTYTMQFWQIRGNLMKMVSEHDGVYAESLRPVFESATGMYLSFARNPRENPVTTSNEPLSYAADLGEIEPLDPSRMAFERARQNLSDFRAGQRLSQSELQDLVARGLLESSEAQAQPQGRVTASALAMHRPVVIVDARGVWRVMVWSPTSDYIPQGQGHRTEHEARQELREWDREHTEMVNRVRAAERGEEAPLVVRQVHAGGSSAAAAVARPAPRALPPPAPPIQSDLIPLNDPAAVTMRAIIAAPVPDVVNPKERGLERKQIASDIRQLLKKLGIKGVGVTVPNYSMASTVHIRVPHVELTEEQSKTPRDAAGNYQRTPVAEAAHRGRSAAVAKLEKIILGAFPDLVDRSDSMTDYHDARLHFE
jgi:hypothetical protein